MNMEIGPEIKRGIILKYKQKLKAALAEHEVKADGSAHLTLLVELTRLVDEHNHENWLGSEWKD